MGYQLWTSPATGHRRKGTRFSELRGIFVNSVQVKNICELLNSCLEEDYAPDLKEELKRRKFDVAGVMQHPDGEVKGFVYTDNLQEGTISQYSQAITTNVLISESTPLADIFEVLRGHNFLFVLFGQSIKGILTRADLNKPMARIYLFGIVSLLEMHMNFWINLSVLYLRVELGRSNLPIRSPIALRWAPR